jgi:hypothetical protein
MIKVISRPPNDEFTFNLFKELISPIKVEFSAFYMWSSPPSHIRNFFSLLQFNRPLVIFGIKDLLDLWTEYHFWNDSQQAGSQLISHAIAKYPNTKFIIFTSLENLDKEISAPNLTIIPWGGDITNQQNEYLTLEPVIEKNFNSTKTFISLNRNGRLHRIVLLSYLFGLKYEQFGDISYLADVSREPQDLLDRVNWRFESRHNKFKELILVGYKALCQPTINRFPDDYDIYRFSANDNVANFNQNLRARYQNTFVEIVTESSFAAPAYLLTEKFLNSVYGCNFPILLSGVGAIAHLREIGFDMFDDIVDNSHDLVANPVDRLIAAVDNNTRLLTDTEYVKLLWKQHQNRLLNNVKVAKTIYKWYENRTKQLLLTHNSKLLLC